MPIFRLAISRDDQLLGHFESDTPRAQAAIEAISRCLHDAGYDLHLQVAHSERRLLESGPKGLRVINREPLFTPVALDVYLQDAN